MSEATVKFGAVDDGLGMTLKKFNALMEEFGEETKQTSEKVGVSFATIAKTAAVVTVGIGAIKGAFAAVKGSFGIFADSISNAANMQTMRTAFIPILGSAEAAQKRLEELAQFASSTPFELPGIIEASRKLQIFAGDALSTGKGLTMIGDVAAGVDKPIEELATWFGRLYDGVASGAKTIGESTARLQELGVISGGARRRIEELHKSGADLGTVWGEVEKEVSRFSGSMKLQSGTWNGIMSTLRDNWNMLLGRFGKPIIEKLTPMLATVANSMGTLLEKAEEFGRKFIGVFLGAENGLKGFQNAVKAFELGDLDLAWRTTFASIKAQIIDTVNSMWKNFKAAFAAVSTFARESLGPGSVFFITATNMFGLLGDMIAKKLTSAVVSIFKDSKIFGGIAENAQETLGLIERDMQLRKNIIKNGIVDLVGDFARGGDAASKAYQDAFAKAGNLIDDTAVKAEIEAVNNEIQSKIEDKKVEVDIEVKPIGELAKGIFQGMSAKGGLQLFPNLKADKVNFEELMEPVVKAAEATKDNAREVEHKAQNTAVHLGNGGGAIERAAKELSKAEQAAKRIADAMKDARIDKGGRLEKELQQALQLEKFAAAQRIQRQLALREERDLIREMFGPKSLRDIAEELGIDTFNKNSKELRAEIALWAELEKHWLESQREQNNQCRNQCSNSHPPTPTQPLPSPAPQDQYERNMLLDVVKTIRDLVQKLERKLPTPALV